METKFIEVTNGPRNWGKFLLLRFDEEFAYPSAVMRQHAKVDPEMAAFAASPLSLLRNIGWGNHLLIVFDLQTREGAAFKPGGNAHCDLEQRRIWVCPMFEPFLEWLYKQDTTDLAKLPAHVDLPGAPFEFRGYRRPGHKEKHARKPRAVRSRQANHA